MPGNIVCINNFDGLNWYVGDSEIEELIQYLNQKYPPEEDHGPSEDTTDTNQKQPAFIQMKDGKRVYCTDVETKKKYWPLFRQMLDNQFMHGGKKYAMDGQEDKEVTDWVCELSPGTTGADWVLQTVAKYCGRYKNFERERDLLKAATYCFIMWLKMGHHLEKEHDEDVSKDKEDRA